MGTPVLPHLRGLADYTPGLSTEDLRRSIGVEDAIKLASNENPLGPSQKALVAARQAVDEAHRYPDAQARGLRDALATHWRASPAEVVVGNGSNTLIDLICRTFAGPDDHAVSGDPSFVCYRLCSTLANVPFDSVELREGVYPEVQPLLAACRKNTKLVFLANPNNPTGTYLSAPQLASLCEGLPPDILLVVDEAYAEFADADDFRSAVQCRGLRERLIILRTFSKAYGLAGMRVGYALAPPSLAEPLRRVQMPFSVSTPAQQAAVAALLDQEHLGRVVEHNRSERSRVSAALSDFGFSVTPGQGNFLLVHVGAHAAQLYQSLLEAGVIVRALSGVLAPYLRVSIGATDENDRLLSTLTTLTRSSP